MLIGFLIELIQLVTLILTLLILVEVVLSFFLNPFHPIRQTLDAVVGPMLAPIRRFMPSTGGLDFSPLVLLILIRLAERILIQILLTLR